MANTVSDQRVVYNTNNGVKPRYDNGGSEFGAMHRDLGPGMCMFDIDRMSASVNMDLELRRENEGFVEYRISNEYVNFVAMFEVKAHKVGRALEALDSTKANSRARLAMAKMLGCRLFIVFGTNGQQPFEFWEVNTETEETEMIGILEYKNGDRADACKLFWHDVLGITRETF